MKNKFIVLRGPSGSGKSTIAGALKEVSSIDTVIVDQDYFNHFLLKGVTDTQAVIPKLIQQTVETLLEVGYNVILEGVLRAEKYGSVIRNISKKYKGQSFYYYLDIGMDETVRRHAGREKAETFSVDEMLTWYSLASPLGFTDEKVLGENMSKEEMVSFIKKQADL